jgi:hypothetical protein
LPHLLGLKSADEHTGFLPQPPGWDDRFAASAGRANRMPWTPIEATLTPIFERRAREGRVSAEVDLFGTAPRIAGAGLSASDVRAGRSR